MIKANLRTVHVPVAQRADFDCNGTLTGRSMHHMPYTGRLPEQYYNDLSEASRAADFYVVESYATPIAWFANGEWFVPNVKYSPTTSRHQSSMGLVRDGRRWNSGSRWANSGFAYVNA